MKRIIIATATIIILLLTLTSCADDEDEDCTDPSSDCYVLIIDDDDSDDDDDQNGDDDTVVTVEIDAEIEIDTEEGTAEIEIEIEVQVTEPEPTFTPKFVLQIDDNVYLSDTNERRLFSTGKIDKAGQDLWLIDDQLMSLDATADAVTLNHTPTQARQTDTALYTCVEIDPVTAAAAGAQEEYYTEFFIDTTGTGTDLISQGHWVTNQMECRDIVSAGDYTFAVSETGQLIQIDGPATVPLYILDGEFVIHNLDNVNNRLDFNSSTESYTMNYLTAASQWIKHADPVTGAVQYYSETGYIWSTDTGLQELATALQDFNADPRPVTLPFGQAQTLISAGVRDGLIYWIEGNTGYVVEYDPIQDTITTPYRLYSGDGTRATGTAYRDTLRPVVVLNYIYFSDGGILKRLDLDTGFFDEVYSGEATLFLID